MKLTIPRLELVALIGKIQNIVPSKPAIPDPRQYIDRSDR